MGVNIYKNRLFLKMNTMGFLKAFVLEHRVFLREILNMKQLKTYKLNHKFSKKFRAVCQKQKEKLIKLLNI